MNHTPTPWKVGIYDASAEFRAIDIHMAVCKPDGLLLATCGPLDEDSQADAAFIVRAVNEYEKNQDTIDTLLDMLKCAQSELLHQGFKPQDLICVDIERAIAKAEGK